MMKDRRLTTWKAIFGIFICICLPITDSVEANVLNEIRYLKSKILTEQFGGIDSVTNGLWFEQGGVEIIATKIKEALNNHRNFVIAFGGTSITAGHDNYFNQSYTEEFRRIVTEPFAHASIPIEIRNVAHGANPHIPYVTCVEEFYGNDVDVVSIEMKVMSKARQTSKKKDPGILSETTSPAAMTEILIRNALHLPRQPAILITDGVYGGPRHKEKRPLRTEPPPLNWPELDSLAALNHGRPDTKSLIRHYKGYGLHRVDVGVATWFVDHLTQFNWETLNGNKAFEHIGWHPGPLNHALKGQLIAYGYLTALEVALNGSVTPPSSAPSHLPKPLLCKEWICEIQTSCASTYIPRPHTSNGLSYFIDGLKDNHTLLYPEPISLKRHPSSSDDDTPSDGTSWRHLLFSKTKSAVRQSITQNRGYLDRKFVLQSPICEHSNSSDNGGDGRLRFKLPRRRYSSGGAAVGFVALCFPWTARGPKDWVPLSLVSMRVWLNGEEVSSASFPSIEESAPLSEGPCVCIWKQEWGDGLSRSSIRQHDEEYALEVEAAEKGKFVTISHVVWR